jgi:hypothetical protein
MQVQFFDGYSVYKNKNVTDKQIAVLVGIETYKALAKIYPNTYSDLTYPMVCSKYYYNEVKNLLSLYNLDITASEFKSYLVITIVDGNDCDIINGFIGLSEPLIQCCVSDLDQIVWVLIVFIIIILIVYVLIFYVYPSFSRCSSRKDSNYYFGWFNKPWN